MTQEELQQKYAKLQLLDQQIKKVQTQLQTLTNHLTELSHSLESLDEFKQVKTGTEILVPIVTGIFAKAELKDVKSLNVNVGSNVSTSKTLDESKQILQEQFQELENIRIRLSNDAQKMIAQAQLLQQDIMAAQQQS
tara:strand:- start:564 stop:974 length:411 start_codon:yes stop_codon:yes gene_type:complete